MSLKIIWTNTLYIDKKNDINDVEILTNDCLIYVDNIIKKEEVINKKLIDL